MNSMTRFLWDFFNRYGTHNTTITANLIKTDGKSLEKFSFKNGWVRTLFSQ